MSVNSKPPESFDMLPDLESMRKGPSSTLHSDIHEQPHSTMVGDKVLTAKENMVYRTVMEVVNQKEALRKSLQENYEQLLVRVEQVKKFKEMKEETEKHLRDELKKEKEKNNILVSKHKKSQETKSLESLKLKNLKHEVIDKLDSLSGKLKSIPPHSLEDEDGKKLCEVMNDLTIKDGNSEYVIATGFNESPDDGDILVGFDQSKLKRQMSELKSLKNNECPEVGDVASTMSGVIDICFSVEEQMKSRNEREKDAPQNVIDLEEFVNLKTSYENVVQENNDLLRMKNDYENVKYEKDKLQHEYKEVQKKLDETQGRLRSFENKSFEIPVNTKFDQEKEDLKSEVKKLKQECERLNKRIKQVENDLTDSEQSFEKADERNCELEDQIIQMTENLKRFQMENQRLHELNNRNQQNTPMIDSLTTQLKLKDDEIQKMNAALAALESLKFETQTPSISSEELTDLRSKHETVSKEKETLQEKNDKLEHDIREIQRNLNEAQDQLKSYENKTFEESAVIVVKDEEQPSKENEEEEESKTKDLLAKIETLESEIEQGKTLEEELKEKNKVLEDKIKSLKNQHEVLRKRDDKISNKYEALKDKFDSLKMKYEEITQKKYEVPLQKSIDSPKPPSRPGSSHGSEYDMCETMTKTKPIPKPRTLKRLSTGDPGKSISDDDRNSNSSSMSNSPQNSLNAEITNLKNEIDRLEKKVKELTEKNGELQSVVDSLQPIKSRNQSLEQEIEELNGKLSDKMLEVGQLRSTLHQSGTELRRHKDQTSEMEGRHEKLHREKNENYNKLQQMTLKYNNKEKESNDMINMLKAERDNYHTERNNYRDEHGRLNMALQKIQIEFQENERQLRSENNHLKMDVDRLKGDVEAHKVQIQVFQTDFEYERETREKEAVKHQQMREEYEKMKQQYEAYKKQNFDQMKNRHQQNPTASGYNPTGSAYGNYQQHNPQYGSGPGGYNQYNPYNQYAGGGGGGGGGRQHQQNQYHGQGGGAQQQGGGGNNPHSELAHRVCPKCNKRCPDIETLEIHLMDCLDD